MPETKPDAAAPAAGDEALRAEIRRLNKVVNALVDRAERMASGEGSDFARFETTLVLERQVRERTAALEAALRENEKITRELQRAKERLERDKEEQRALILKLEASQQQLMQSERSAAIGQLAAGVAHEINNPIGFINSNLRTLKDYTEDLLRLVAAYETLHPGGVDAALLQDIDAMKRKMDIEFVKQDLVQLVDESISGAERIRRIVQNMRDFAHVGEQAWQTADLHVGLETTLALIADKIGPEVRVVREFGRLPTVECMPAEINLALVNLLLNAVHAITGAGTITLRTGSDDEQAWISVSDTGVGIAPEILPRIFDPFFTTRPVGLGTGLGLFVTKGIIEKHRGWIEVDSIPGHGSTFTLKLPLVHQPVEAGAALPAAEALVP